MKSKLIKVFWGVILILGGVFFLARNAGYFPEIPDGVWKYLFATVSLLFLTTWLASGIQNWGWLFPACIPLGLSITILLGEIGGFGSIAATPLLASIALPFIAAFLIDTKRNKWALIPAWVMLVISLITLISDKVDGNIMGTFVLYSIGLPFLVVYLMNRKNWWALIPAGVMAVIGTFPLLGTVLNGVYMDVAVMLLFAVSFLVVFFWSKNNWWALIPAGVFMSIAVLITLLKLKIVAEGEQSGIPSAIILAGIGLTFGILWLMRKIQPTDWAKYPALGLFTAAILAAFTGRNFQIFWPIVLIVIGLSIIISFVFWKPAKKNEGANITEIE